MKWNCSYREYNNREEWLAARRGGIGASDTAGIFGVGYSDQSIISIWDQKVRGASDHTDDERLQVGKDLEPGLIKIFQRKEQVECRPAGDFVIYQNLERPFLQATLDGIAVVEGVEVPAELKNVGSFNASEWDGDEVPLKFNVQVQHQLAVTGCEFGYLFALIGGNRPVVRRIYRNDRFISVMIARLEEFWDFVASGEIPPIDASEATKSALTRMWPRDNGLTKELPIDSIEWDERLSALKLEIKKLEAEKTAIENRFKAEMQDATIGFCPNGSRYTWASHTKKSYVVQESSSRPFRKG